MFYLLSILLSILGGAAIAFGQAEYGSFDGQPVAIKGASSLKLRPLELQGGILPYRLNEGRKLEFAGQENDAILICLGDRGMKPAPFREIPVIDRLENRWLHRYKKSSICTAELTQGRALTKQAVGKAAATAVLLILLVGMIGTAFLLSPKRGEPLKPLAEIFERAH